MVGHFKMCSITNTPIESCPVIRNDHLKLYTKKELILINKLTALFNEWNNTYQKYREDKADLTDYEIIVPDGFYPNYLCQKTKFLFIGRESYTIEQCNYIDLFIENYLNGTTGQNKTSINKDKFHKMLIQVTYGLMYNKAWEEIPQASELCHNKEIFNKISFAFMNLSKLSNNLSKQKTTNTNWNLVNHSLEMSLNCNKNYILEEIKLLNPDLIITMNLGRNILKQVFEDNLSFEENNWWKYVLSVPEKKKKCVLIDSWHFSSTKKEKEDIYDNIKNNI